MEPNNSAAREAAQYAHATGAPAARSGPPPVTPDDIHSRFSFHPALSETRRRNHNHVRELCERLAMALAGNLPNPSRELSIALTHLEDVMHWGNKALAVSPDPAAVDVVEVSAIEKAQRAYDAYGAVTQHRNFQGDPMPAWDSLGDTIQAAWIAAATAGGSQ